MKIANKATGEDTVPIKLLRLLTVLALVLLPAAAHAKRLALVIGIDRYEALPKLERAVNDAEFHRQRLSKASASRWFWPRTLRGAK